MNLHRGQRIVRVARGPWSPAAGTELPGLTGSTWYYASCYIELESGEIYELTQRSFELAVFSGAVPLEAVDTPPSLVVEDVFMDEAGEIRVLLADGIYLENSWLPGGSSICFGHLSEWSAEELAEPHTSLLDGRKFFPRELVTSVR